MYIYNTKTKQWTKGPFLNLVSDVLSAPVRADERGLLGMAFHPNYKDNGRLFVYYSTERQEGDTIPDGLPPIQVYAFFLSYWTAPL